MKKLLGMRDLGRKGQISKNEFEQIARNSGAFLSKDDLNSLDNNYVDRRSGLLDYGQLELDLGLDGSTGKKGFGLFRKSEQFGGGSRNGELGASGRQSVP